MTLSKSSSPYELVPIGRLVDLEADSQLLQDLIEMIIWVRKDLRDFYEYGNPDDRKAIETAVKKWKNEREQSGIGILQHYSQELGEEMKVENNDQEKEN